MLLREKSGTSLRELTSLRVRAVLRDGVASMECVASGSTDLARLSALFSLVSLISE